MREKLPVVAAPLNRFQGRGEFGYLSACQVLGSKFPVDQILQHSGNVVGSPVLVVQVVGMLPNINGEQWLLTVGDGRISIAGFGNDQLVTVFYQPGPTATELTGSRLGELGLEGVVVAKGLVD